MGKEESLELINKLQESKTIILKAKDIIDEDISKEMNDKIDDLINGLSENKRTVSESVIKGIENINSMCKNLSLAQGY